MKQRRSLFIILFALLCSALLFAAEWDLRGSWRISADALSRGDSWDGPWEFTPGSRIKLLIPTKDLKYLDYVELRAFTNAETARRAMQLRASGNSDMVVEQSVLLGRGKPESNGVFQKKLLSAFPHHNWVIVIENWQGRLEDGGGNIYEGS